VGLKRNTRTKESFNIFFPKCPTHSREMFDKFESQHSLSPTIWSDIVVGRESGYLNSVYHHKSCDFESRSWWGVLDTTLCDKVCQWLVTCWCFSLPRPVHKSNFRCMLQYTPSVSTLILSGRTYSSQNVRLTPEKCSTNLRVNTLWVLWVFKRHFSTIFQLYIDLLSYLSWRKYGAR
jgi:hypothetical protein